MKRRPTALVTGAAIRVGRAIALELDAAGYRIAIHYHGSERAARDLHKRLKGSTLHRASLEHPGEIGLLAAEVAGKHGKIDVLVNSAAIFFPTPLGKTTMDQWDSLHHLNLRAPYFLTQAVVPNMPKGGVVINIADVAGMVPWPSYIPYAATKAGVIAMTHGLARALAPGIRVNAVAPGPVMLPEAYDVKARKRSIEKTLLGRVGKAEDVARAVRFLVENDYLTGVVLPVDGGRLIA